MEKFLAGNPVKVCSHLILPHTQKLTPTAIWQAKGGTFKCSRIRTKQCSSSCAVAWVQPHVARDAVEPLDGSKLELSTAPWICLLQRLSS
eukprot:1158744-Pelagomonas_calceolata.AAC.1